MRFSNVNEQALIQASTFLVGPQATNAVIQLYKLIDQAMKDGYDLGKFEAQQDVETKLDDAFDNGFEEGARSVVDGSDTARGEGWDAGYLDGVRDARAQPWLADMTVQDILSDMGQFAINGEYDAGLVQDSGDETD